MARPRVYKTEAIVLKGARMGEADKLLTLYTPHLGLLKAVAKGVCRTRSKMGGHLELLTHSTLMLAQGRNLDIITQCETISSFLPLRADLWRTSCALYAAELVDLLAAENVENRPLFRLLLDTLERLCQAGDGELTLRYFELHLMDYLGYRPELGRCLGCGSELEPVTNLFSPSAGGVLCPNCSQGQPPGRPLSLNALKMMRLLQRGDYATASRVKLRPELASELEGSLRGYITYLLEREVRSAAWLDRLRREASQKGTHPGLEG